MGQKEHYDDEHTHTGLVVRSDRAGWTVQVDGQRYVCTGLNGAPDRARTQHPERRGRRHCAVRPAGGATPVGDEIAVGDAVTVAPTGPQRGRIVAVTPRRNQITRRAAGPKPVAQVIAANVDQLVAVFAAAAPAPSWAMLDRYLVIAEAAGVDALICVTKDDLADELRLAGPLNRYRQIGYRVVRVAASEGRGLDALTAELCGRVSLLAGKSGVGKTTLLNALLPDSALRTAAVNARSGKGRHTTTCVELFALPCSGSVIDTPGVRELGLWNIANAELAGLFPEMRSWLGACRFSGCTHVHEPGCALRQAVERGDVTPERYESYRRMLDIPATGHKHAANAERTPAETPEEFRCARCGWRISATAAGTRHRNHCPQCLWSVHVDNRPGDRVAACRAAMEPIAVWVQPDGEWALVHRCSDCGAVRTNRIAGDDNPAALMSLAARAIARPPFPLDRVAAQEAV